MSNVETISNDRNSKTPFRPDCRRLNFRICFGFRISNFEFCREAAFTIIELLVVIALIIILAGLILSTIGYVQSKAARSRAETEIAAMSAALENYKADNGIYPAGKSITTPPSGSPLYTAAATGTNDLDARTKTDATQKIYQDASRYLYEQLSGDVNLNFAPAAGAKTYFAFKQNMLAVIKDPTTGNVVGLSHIRDPFGNSYGYSTAGNPQANPTPAATPVGYNPTFDLWSTASATTGTSNQTQWIKNW